MAIYKYYYLFDTHCSGLFCVLCWYLFTILSHYVCLSVCLSIYLFFWLLVCLSVRLSVSVYFSSSLLISRLILSLPLSHSFSLNISLLFSLLYQVILTGHPIRVRKKFAVVKHMFYEPMDVRWFKPAEMVKTYTLFFNIIYRFHYQ